MRARNINGTADRVCRFGSWLNHWQNFSGVPLPSFCYQKSWMKTPEVGAHVQKESLFDDRWYIIPLCYDCNNRRGETIEIMDSAALVSANKRDTCER